MKKQFLASLLSLGILFSLGVVMVHAQVGSTPSAPTVSSGPQPTKINNPFKVCGSSGCGVLDLMNAIIDNIVMPIAGVLIVLAFIWTGFLYVAAQGNPTKLETAGKMLRFTVIGAAIILGAAAITKVISGTLDQLSQSQ